MTWRVARSLRELLHQVDAAHPGRDRSNDGTIGDQVHQNRSSDHNPWVRDGDVGIVTAMDISHDPRGGFDSYKFADLLKANHDRRLKYIISNSRIWNPSIAGEWREYHGSNPHDHHVHISVSQYKSFYDDASPWAIGEPTAPQVSTDGAEWMPGFKILAVVATVFGGSGEFERSAYDGHRVDGTEFSVAMPYRFKGERPNLRLTNSATRQSAIATVSDVGPWNTNDPWWKSGNRPQAESGRDHRGRRTNRAGIDLSPALAKALGISGIGKVDVEFM